MLSCCAERTHSLANHQQPCIQFSTIQHRNSIYSKYPLLIDDLNNGCSNYTYHRWCIYITTASFEYFIICQTSSKSIQAYISNESTKSFQLSLVVYLITNGSNQKQRGCFFSRHVQMIQRIALYTGATRTCSTTLTKV